MKTIISALIIMTSFSLYAQQVPFDDLNAVSGTPKTINWTTSSSHKFRLTNDYYPSLSPIKSALKIQFNGGSTWSDYFAIYNSGEFAMGAVVPPSSGGPDMMLDVRGTKPFQFINTATGQGATNYHYIGRDGAPGTAHSYLYHRISTNYQLIGSSKSGTGTLRDLGFAVGGSDWESDVKLEIEASTGNVGIGTGGSAQYAMTGIPKRLTVANQSGDVAIRLHSVPANTWWDIVNSAGSSNVNAGNFAILGGINSTNMFCIDWNGNVGIGSQTPTSRLEVAKSGHCDITALGYGASCSSAVWAATGLTSFGIWNDVFGEGHIAQNMGSPLKMINFKWNSTLSEPQVWIGSKKPTGTHADFRLSVDGKLTAKEVVIFQSPWADFVFDDHYKLMNLDAVEQFYLQNKHLPGVPTASEINENGNNLASTDAILLKKIEELTLYVVEQKKELEQLREKLNSIQVKTPN